MSAQSVQLIYFLLVRSPFLSSKFSHSSPKQFFLLFCVSACVCFIFCFNYFFCFLIANELIYFRSGVRDRFRLHTPRNQNPRVDRSRTHRNAPTQRSVYAGSLFFSLKSAKSGDTFGESNLYTICCYNIFFCICFPKTRLFWVPSL